MCFIIKSISKTIFMNMNNYFIDNMKKQTSYYVKRSFYSSMN